jgi:hypothetical protein
MIPSLYPEQKTSKCLCTLWNHFHQDSDFWQAAKMFDLDYNPSGLLHLYPAMTIFLIRSLFIK